MFVCQESDEGHVGESAAVSSDNSVVRELAEVNWAAAHEPGSSLCKLPHRMLSA